MLIAALDIGSVATKALLWSTEKEKIIAVRQAPSAWRPREAAAECLLGLTQDGPGGPPDILAVTGYGRNLLEGPDGRTSPFGGRLPAPRRFNEITALARGVGKSAPEARLVLDVGGQDSKALAIDDRGRVLDFMLNDKCAAGAGAFIDAICQSFNLDHKQFGELAAGGQPAALSSMCAVFAQTELVAQAARGISRADLAAGILASLAARLKTQCGRLFSQNPVALTGGLSRLPIFAEYLSKSLGAPVTVPDRAPFLAALGAALMAAEEAAAS